MVIITYRRPEHLRRCLSAVGSQTRAPEQVIVVDQSPDDLSRVIALSAGARWVDNRANAGNMTSSRNVAMRLVEAEVVSFVDDDCEPAPEWAASVLECFERHPEAAVVGGRVTHSQSHPNASDVTVGSISRWGRVIGNFEVAPLTDISVMHALGTNMSFRAASLRDLGGFREDFPGTSMGEDTDVCLRLYSTGATVIFCPSAVVLHTGAPHVKGRRFDLRYQFYAACNYTLLLRRNFGAGSTQFVGHLARSVSPLMETRSLAGRIARCMANIAGSLFGMYLCLKVDGRRRPGVVRIDGVSG